MTEIIENKSVQVQMFREKLRSVKKGATFVKSSYNDIWSSSLNKIGTEDTKISSWHCKNSLGQIIQKVAKIIRKRKRSDHQLSKAKQKSKFKQDLKQQDITKMLRNIRLLFWHRCLIWFWWRNQYGLWKRLTKFKKVRVTNCKRQIELVIGLIMWVYYSLIYGKIFFFYFTIYASLNKNYTLCVKFFTLSCVLHYFVIKAYVYRFFLTAYAFVFWVFFFLW